MPYQGWHRIKPNVTHLWEFGAPVWILLQGQNKAHKILPKSKRHVYIRYDDVSKSVKYYNLQIRKILTSHNYIFLATKKNEPPKEIILKDTPPHEGEQEGSDVQRDVPDPQNPSEMTEPNKSHIP